MAAAVRWCFPAADTLGQLESLRVVRVVRLLSVCRPSSVTLGQTLRLRSVSVVRLLTARQAHRKLIALGD